MKVLYYDWGSSSGADICQGFSNLNIEYDMASLLEDVAKTGIKRIKFVTSHPWDFTLDMIGVIKEYDNILSYLKKQYNKTNDKDLLIDTIKSYEYENRTNNCIREILEEKILNEYLKSEEGEK